MSNRLDPLILKKLQAFNLRRRKLIIIRGVLTAVATLLATMMGIALIDWIFVLPDGVRWGLSAAAYLAVVIVEWRSCLRLLVFAPNSRRLARLLEHAAPNLREDLLSAVELGDQRGDAVYDSEQFRALLQSNVASRMEAIDMDRLLPVQLVRRSMGVAIGIAVACLAAFALTGFQFGTLMMRALLPMANLARVSKVQVEVVDPHPAEAQIPQGDTVPLLIELSGQRANKAMLETFTKQGGREVLQMHPVSANRFSATIQVGREDVLYRVRAGDAITRKYRLGAVARPAVVEFEKTYTYPTYSRLAVRRVTEENGDLAALENTQVELRLKTNQKIREGELRVEQGKKSFAVKLTEQNGMLTGKLALDASGIYRVHLIGAESGFENKFSPEFELRAEPDLKPQVELELPRQDLILPANEIVEVQGEASDDLALAKVSQLVKINDGGWKETVLLENPGAKTKVDRRWDLFEQGVKPGDLVTMKLAATDLKGSRAESRPVQVTITAAGFEVKRMQTVEMQRQLHRALQALRTASEKLEQRGRETREQFDRTAEGDAQRKQAVVAALGALEEFDHKQAEAASQLIATLKNAEGGHESAATTLLGLLLARTQGGIEPARVILGLLSTNPDAAFAREQLHEAEAPFSRVRTGAIVAEDAERAFLAQEEIDVLNENLRVVAQEQQRLAELARSSGSDAGKWMQTASRQRVVIAEARGLEDLMGAASEHASDGGADRLRNMRKQTNKQRVAVDQALAAAKAPGAELLNPMVSFSTTLAETVRIGADLKRALAHVPSRIAGTLLNEGRPIFASLEELRPETENLRRNVKLPDDARAALIEARWAMRLSLMKQSGDVEEARPDADAYFVQDLRAATRAVQAVHDSDAAAAPEKLGPALAPIEKDLRLLETAHRLGEIVDGLHHVATGERWEIFNPRARTSNPTDWRWFEARLKASPEDLNRALTAPELAATRNKVRESLARAMNDSSAQRLNQEMNDRTQPEREPQSVAKEAERLAALVKEALELLRKPIEEARKEIASLAPSVSKMAAQLAKETEKLKEQTAEQAPKNADQKRDADKAAAQQTLAAQQKLNEKVDALKDALRADANEQDILKKEGRERARDADDALAMLKEPPVRAEEDLQRAAQSDQAATREQAMQQAAAQQQKMAEALQAVAQHYDNLEKGTPEESRTALRATEQPNGVKEQLDQQFAEAERMEQMAKATPQDLLAQLEKALPNNPQMRQELSAISRNTLKSAADQLQKASGQENAVAQQVEKMAAEQQALHQAEAAANAGAQPETKAPSSQNPPAAQQQNPPAQTPAQAAAQPQANTPSPASAQPQAQTPAQKSQAATPSASSPPPNGAKNQQAQNQPAAPAPGQPPAAASPQPMPPPNPALAQAAQQQAPIAQTANEAGDEIARAGRHEERLQNPMAGEQLQQLGSQIQATAQQQVPNAQRALEQAHQAEQARGAVNAANGELKAELGQLAKAQEGAAQNNQTNAPAAAPAPEQGQAAPVPNSPAPAAPKNAANPGDQAQATPPATAAAQPQNASQTAKAGEQRAQASGQQPATGQSPAPASGTSQAPPAGAPPASGTPNSPPPSSPAGMESQAPQIAAATAPPQQQVWMARTLDTLDAALHAQAANSPDSQAGQQQSQPSQSQNGQGQQPGKEQSGAMAQAQDAMSAAAQAAAASMRASRSQTPSDTPGGPLAKGGQQAVSKAGAQASAAGTAHGALAEAKNQPGDWGKLPKKMAEQLSQGRQEGIPGEYRNQVETYYRVIAEKSKKQP